MLIKILKYILLFLFGMTLSLGYSYLINGMFAVETSVVFFALYVYIVFFIKFLIKIFK